MFSCSDYWFSAELINSTIINAADRNFKHQNTMWIKIGCGFLDTLANIIFFNQRLLECTSWHHSSSWSLVAWLTLDTNTVKIYFPGPFKFDFTILKFTLQVFILDEEVFSGSKMLKLNFLEYHLISSLLWYPKLQLNPEFIPITCARVVALALDFTNWF